MKYEQALIIGKRRRADAELHGQPVRSRNREHLVHKVAWRIQAFSEGNISDRPRHRTCGPKSL